MKFGTHHYKPLIQELTIAESPINGLGLFAVENIKAGIFLGESHIWEANRWEYIRTPLGGFINHTSEPNCYRIKIDSKQWIIKTNKNIKDGEELTLKYSLYEV